MAQKKLNEEHRQEKSVAETILQLIFNGFKNQGRRGKDQMMDGCYRELKKEVR